MFTILDMALKGEDAVETRSAKQKEAWPGCKRESKGRNSSKVHLLYLEADLPNVSG